MKIKILSICFLLIHNLVFSQGISHEQLITLSFKNFYEIKDFLLQKDYFQSNNTNKDGMTIIEFENSYLNEKVSVLYVGNLNSSRKSISLESKSKQIYSEFVKFVHQKGCKNTSDKYKSANISEWSCSRFDVLIYDGEEKVRMGLGPEIVTPLYSFTIYPK